MLRLFDAVPRFTRAKKEAGDLAKTIREKRALAASHGAAVDRGATSAPRPGSRPAAAPAPAATQATSPEDCKAARKHMTELTRARARKGMPQMGAYG